MPETEYETGFSLKARVDRVIWVSCKSEEIVKCRIGGRQTLDRRLSSQGHPWLILIREGEPVAKAFSKSRHSILPEHKRVTHEPHYHEVEQLLDDQAEVQLAPPYCYDIDLAKFMKSSFYELCHKEKNSFLELLVVRIRKIQSRRDWLTSGS